MWPAAGLVALVDAHSYASEANNRDKGIPTGYKLVSAAVVAAASAFLVRRSQEGEREGGE